MKTPNLGPAIGLGILILAICHGEPAPQESSLKGDTEPSVSNQAKAPENEAPYSDKFVALKETLSLAKIRTTEVETLNEERRAIVASIAKDKGVKESEVLAEFYKKWPDTNSILGRAYLKSPEIAVGSFLLGLDGQGRATALISYASSLSRRDELNGLRRMYELLPVGKDRARISSTLVQMIGRLQGIEKALEALVSLSPPEEKRTALLGFCANIASVKKSPSEEELDRIYAVARAMGYESAARSSITAHLQFK